MPKQVAVVILAAGAGRRMSRTFGHAPKVLLPVNGIPMVVRVVDTVLASNVSSDVVVVIGYDSPIPRVLARFPVSFVVQPQPLGTGNAVLMAQSFVPPTATTIVVLLADQPLLSPSIVRTLVMTHLQQAAILSMFTLDLVRHSRWTSAVADWGRIIRTGKSIRVVEARTASDKELSSKEANPAIWCFSADFLWTELQLLRADNEQGEYHLSDLVGRASLTGLVNTLPVPEPREVLAANNLQQFLLVDRIARVLDRERGFRQHWDRPPVE